MRAVAGRHLPKLAGQVRSGASYARHQRQQAIGLRGNAFAGQLVDGGRRWRGDGRRVGLEPQPAPRRPDDDRRRAEGQRPATRQASAAETSWPLLRRHRGIFARR